MRKFVWLLLVCSLATPGWCARKITVSQLEEMLRSLQQNKKSDVEMATALEQVELSQELTRKKMSVMMGYSSGPLSTEQIYVLEARSAMLVPAEEDTSQAPAPDDATRKAILDRAATYVTSTYDQLPDLGATKTTLRFQDNMEAVAQSSGITGGARDVVTNAGFSNPAAFLHYLNSTEARVSSVHGSEKPASQKEKIPWGANKMIALQEPDPSLGRVFDEVESSGSLQWLRWQKFNGADVAVFSFAVPAGKSKMAVKVCCFPNVKQTGIANFYTAITAQSLGTGGGGGPGGGVSGNFQTNTEWHAFEAAVPYTGELFVHPATGTILRMITRAELKASDVVHQVDTRIDYGPTRAGDKTVFVPMASYVNTEVVPKGDSGAGTYTTRRTLFTSVYKDYQLSSK